MSMKDRTKWVFAGCLEEMLRSMDFDDIYVSDICTRCDTNRQNFYYHFHDKYDLAAWLFLKDVDICACTQCMTVQEKLILSLRKAWERRDFYIKIIGDLGHRQIMDYIHKYNVERAMRIVGSYYGLRQINRQMQLAISFYSYGAVCTTFDWLTGQTDLTAEELGTYQYQMMPDFLREAYRQQTTVRFV